MNNEEKILSILETMQAEQGKTNERLDRIETDISDIKVDVENIKVDVENIKGDVENIKGDVENIKVDVENIKMDVESLKEDIEILKEDSEANRSGINTLLDWAERSEAVTQVKLFPKANQG